MTKKELIEEIENARHAYMDYYNDHKPMIEETTGVKLEDPERDSYDIDTLSNFYSEVMEWEASEYDDCFYVAGMIHALDDLLRVINLKEGN